MHWLAVLSNSEGNRRLQFNHSEIFSEFAHLTSFEGFIGACLELKENMLFYDRDLVLSAFGSTVEFWSLAALFAASLAGDAAAEEMETRLGEQLEQFLASLSISDGPLDIQDLAARFVQNSGWVAAERYPVYVSVMRCYRADGYHQAPSVDALLRRANQQAAAENWAGTVKTLGMVGAKLLQGEKVRPFWFRICSPRLKLWLSGLHTIVSNWSVTSYFAYPLSTVHTERQKREKVGGSLVVDLTAFRNLRTSSVQGFTDQRVQLNPDDDDLLLALLLETSEAAPGEASDSRCDLISVLAAIVESGHLENQLRSVHVERALHTLTSWQCREAADAVLVLLQNCDFADPLFEQGLEAIRVLGYRAVKAVRKRLRNGDLGTLQIPLAEALSRSAKSRRVFGLLVEMFDKAEWGSGKEWLGSFLLVYGADEAKKVVEGSLGRLDPSEQVLYNRILKGC